MIGTPLAIPLTDLVTATAEHIASRCLGSVPWSIRYGPTLHWVPEGGRFHRNEGLVSNHRCSMIMRSSTPASTSDDRP
jgi:hypothetical protein